MGGFSVLRGVNTFPVTTYHFKRGFLYGRKNSPNQKHDERRGNFVEHGHVDVVLAQPRVPPDHGYQNRPVDSKFSDSRFQGKCNVL